jgi:Plasmid stabilization system protein
MPKKFRVEITRSAEVDIREIYLYVSEDSELSAINLVQELENQIKTLETFPMRCAVIPESQDLGTEYRHLIYGNYRTIFKMVGSRVIIMRVIHGARLLEM